MSFVLSAEQRRNPAALGYVEFVAMIALLMALNAAAIDIYIPALQDIGSALGVTDENKRQFVITAYVLGFGGAQIIYGPLSDRYGRRPVLFGGLAIYLAGAIAAVFVPTFEALLVTRLVQGIGAAATRVIATSVVRDRFGGAQMASVMSLVMMVFMVMPVFAPNIGSVVMAFGTWRELSGFMVVFGLVAMIWAWARLPETLDPTNRRPLRVKPVAEAFGIVLTNRIAFCYTLAMASFFGALFAFIGQAEQIYTGIYVLGPQFTLYFSLVAVFMAGSSFANSRLVARFGIRRLSHGALIGFIVMAALHLALAVFYGGATPFPLFLILFIGMMCFFGFVPTNFNAMAMEPLGRVAGVASSVLGCAQTLGGGLLGALVGYLYDGTLIPLLSGFLVLAVMSLGCVLVAERGRLFGA
ncbi:MFS transporter, DHA1 family, bicyclomycin/chloramphenicol resistance protein [Loktanella fryxellensis]|uniref:Bcr/CflA family efflux transporter n=1 Tax=Loktanella fryxellensis TaxID=245187 RepID=A0A1H8BRH8_9RHOB|nr:multidrug effflux MFS transporter [Loktanella fryxellensis]SEM85491.1 MFS transporter, DHA1 family, bicyclomycin/chloramphenicol resistance protein [Loktanella fryxellensis]